MARPTLQQLSYLVALADERHFGRAAQACFISQPALSSQIKELERRLGSVLVERTSRGVLMTPAGERAVAAARQVLQLVDDFVATIDADNHELSGVVNLGVIPTLAPYVLPTVVPVVKGGNPRVDLRVRELRTEALLDELAAGALDLGLVASGDTLPGLVHEPLAIDTFMLATSERSELADAGDPVGIDALRSHPVLLLEDGHCLRDQAIAVCELADAATSTVYDTSLATLVQMVAAGQGVTLLPASAAGVEARKGNGITTLRFDAPPPSRTIALAWRSTSPRAQRYRALADALRPALERALGRQLAKT